jgi:O-antigen ligase
MVDCFIKTSLFVLTLFVSSKNIKIYVWQIDKLLKLLILTGFIAGLMLAIQCIAFAIYGIADLGKQMEGTARIGFAGLFYDFSIMSVYMSSLSGILLVMIVQKQICFNRVLDVLLSLLFISASVLTSARSGVASLFMTVVIILICYERRKILIYSILMIPIFQIIMTIFQYTRKVENLAYDNGRYENFNNALSYFYNHLIWGSGFIGYTETTGHMRPHNFVLDMLVDSGLFITVIFLFLFWKLFKNGIRKYPKMAYLFLFFLIGGMFHSSFLNTHYVMIPAIILSSYIQENENPAHNKLSQILRNKF